MKSRNDVKMPVFLHVLCHISAIFEDIDLKFCTHIHETLPSNILKGFLNIFIWGKTVLKRKKKKKKEKKDSRKPFLLVKIGET